MKITDIEMKSNYILQANRIYERIMRLIMVWFQKWIIKYVCLLKEVAKK